MDLAAELAAFEAEVGTLAATVEVDASAPAPPAAAATSQPAAATSTAVPGAAAGSTATSANPVAALASKKRKATEAAGDAAGAAPSKRPAVVVVSFAAPTPAALPPSVAASGGAFADLVEADRAAMAQQQQEKAAAAAGSGSAAASSSDAAAAAASCSAAAAAASGYIPGRIYNGWLAAIHPVTGEPMWVEPTLEQVAAAAANTVLDAAEAAAAAEAAHKAALKAARRERKAAQKAGKALPPVPTAQPAIPGQKVEKHHLRTAAGKVWDDPTLEDWPDNDYRLFCGDLGNEVSESLLCKMFDRWPSFAKAKVIREKRTGKSKGFAFVSFTDQNDMIAALKECDGKYVGNRPIRLRRSEWTKRDATQENRAKLQPVGNTGTRADKSHHLY